MYIFIEMETNYIIISKLLGKYKEIIGKKEKKTL